mmetsp:Transcript_31538/g.71250  ORF Transcript_31538/g.71250 Transcript_31538/m.71250 type:complete len:87 (-) Transcript_31538:628-888(-)
MPSMTVEPEWSGDWGWDGWGEGWGGGRWGANAASMLHASVAGGERKSEKERGSRVAIPRDPRCVNQKAHISGGFSEVSTQRDLAGQ